VPRTCTICAHGNRAALESALIEGVPLQTILDCFPVSKTALLSHEDNHLPAHLMKAKEAEEVARADGLLSQVRYLHDRTLVILTASEEAGELRTALRP
jgi:hypothetical protein